MFKRKKKGSEFWLVQGLKKEEEDKKEINPTIPAELINDNFLRGVTRTDHNGDPCDFRIDGITLKGQNLLLNIQKEKRESSLLYKFWSVITFSLGAVAVKSLDWLDLLLTSGK